MGSCDVDGTKIWQPKTCEIEIRFGILSKAVLNSADHFAMKWMQNFCQPNRLRQINLPYQASPSSHTPSSSFLLVIDYINIINNNNNNI